MIWVAEHCSWSTGPLLGLNCCMIMGFAFPMAQFTMEKLGHNQTIVQTQ